MRTNCGFTHLTYATKRNDCDHNAVWGTYTNPATLEAMDKMDCINATDPSNDGELATALVKLERLAAAIKGNPAHATTIGKT